MMRTLSLALLLLALGSSSAFALGKFGVRVGAGTSFYDAENDGGDDPDISPLAVGAAWRFNVALLGVEVDALYWRNSMEQEALGTKIEGTSAYFALPIMGRLNFPIIPALLKLNVGAGVEPRFLLSAEAADKDIKDDMESMVIYAPLLIGATIKGGPLVLNVDMRYERQMTNHAKESEDKIHQLMFFAGAFF